jgi:hypothetical protein
MCKFELYQRNKIDLMIYVVGIYKLAAALKNNYVYLIIIIM